MSGNNGIHALTEIEIRDTQIEMLSERINDLELALEDRGWLRLGTESEYEFSRRGLDSIVKWARLSYLVNPIINHAVEVQAHYVFGQGVSISATVPEVQDVVRAFLDLRENQDELTSQQAMLYKEIGLQVDGNIFFALFLNTVDGTVRVRTLPVEEVRDIITNPDDRRDPWFYQREWNQKDSTGTPQAMKRLYPDWRYSPKNKPQTYNGTLIVWETPVYHVRVGGLSGMTFGVPEVYSALPWARSVKEFHETAATVRAAQARFAAQLTTPGKSGVSAAKSKLGTTIATGNGSGETNPPPGVGSVLTTTDDYKYNLLKLAGNAPSPDEAAGLVEMAAAGAGVPVTMLMGKADIGNLATAKSLDRPTELKMRTRQVLWADVFHSLLEYAVDWAITAPRGALRGLAIKRPDGTIEMRVDPTTGQPYDRHIDVDFPPILVRDTMEIVNAIKEALPLGLILPRQAAAIVMTALGMDDVDEELAQLFPDDGQQADVSQNLADDSEEARFTEALQDMRAALVALAKPVDSAQEIRDVVERATADGVRSALRSTL